MVERKVAKKMPKSMDTQVDKAAKSDLPKARDSDTKTKRHSFAEMIGDKLELMYREA